jgi:hypothetical protein
LGPRTREFRVMCIIPLDLERRIEQRWAARLSRPVELTKPEKHQFEKPDQPLAVLPKAKVKIRRVEAAGLRPLPTV